MIKLKNLANVEHRGLALFCIIDLKKNSKLIFYYHVLLTKVSTSNCTLYLWAFFKTTCLKCRYWLQGYTQFEHDDLRLIVNIPIIGLLKNPYFILSIGLMWISPFEIIYWDIVYIFLTMICIYAISIDNFFLFYSNGVLKITY